MGYRTYIRLIENKKILEFQNISSIKELINFSNKNKNYIDTDYVGINEVFNPNNYEFYCGDFVTWTELVQDEEGISILNKFTEPIYRHTNNVFAIKQAGLGLIIEEYHKSINDFYKHLQDSNCDSNFVKNSIKERQAEWNNINSGPYNYEDKFITTSRLPEYSIFELIRLYKETNWNKFTLVLYSY